MTRPKRPTLIVPVESQVREFDAKLLWSCCAAERGYRVVIGSRAYVHFAIADLPRGLYAAKSMRSMSDLMFRLIRDVGHDIIGWEEEALVHPPPEIFYPLRLSPGTMPFVSHLFAWGEENRDLIQGYAHYPQGLPVHVTGNPRGDMLRPELRAYFDEDVRRLREDYGDFVLINTNFTDVNPFLPSLGLFKPAPKPGQPRKPGQAGKGMPRAFAEGLEVHKQAILDDFIAMIPALADAFPDLAVVVRPHPSEDHAVYQALAERNPRIKVAHEGNVLPWLLASRALVHNGCTTAIESYVMGVPSLAYLATWNEAYDRDFQGLPNELSVACADQEALNSALGRILAGDRSDCASPERDAALAHYLVGREGPLACERILDVLDASYPDAGHLPTVPPFRRWRASWMARVKASLTQLYMRRPGPNRQAYHDHRFPRLSVADVERRIARLGGTLGRFEGLQVEQRSEHVFGVFQGPG
jgi:surface carbohydrate biosynthesis protein